MPNETALNEEAGHWPIDHVNRLACATAALESIQDTEPSEYWGDVVTGVIRVLRDVQESLLEYPSPKEAANAV